jgi:mono/diheme cytochrome c family protein
VPKRKQSNVLTLAIVATGILVASAAAQAEPLQGEPLIERGGYLVKAVAACQSCHTPKDPSALPLSGGTRYGSDRAAVFAPNITPDIETGIGTWSKQQIIDAIRRGIRPDGSRIGPPMPQEAYKSMSDEDAEAIALYLKSVTPVHHSVPRTTPVDPPSRPDRALPIAEHQASMDDALSRGRYIATALAHCTECHRQTTTSSAAPNPDQKDRIFRGPWGAVAAPNISAEALHPYTDAQLAAIITKGVRPDGSSLVGPMPVAAYAGLKPDDLAVVIAYLREPLPSAYSTRVKSPEWNTR